MIARGLALFGLVALIGSVGVPAAHGEGLVANVAAAAGSVEVRRGGKGEWQAVSVGSPVYGSDAVRTGTSSAAKLLFIDDAVVSLAPSTELAIVQYATDRSGRRSLVRLADGKIETLTGTVTGKGARYEVESPTAVARAEGTVFIVRYDSTAQATDVVGVDGTVAVQGTTGIIGPGVTVGPNETTRVPRDGFPTPVKALDASEARDFTQGLRLIGTGTRDGLDTDNPTVDGRVVAAEDRPPTGVVASATAPGSYLHPDVPGQTLIGTLSPDIRANNQPLPVYRAVPPNQSPNPPH